MGKQESVVEIYIISASRETIILCRIMMINMICKTLTRLPFNYTTTNESEMRALLPLFYLVQLISLAFLQKNYLTLDAKRCLTG